MDPGLRRDDEDARRPGAGRGPISDATLTGQPSLDPDRRASASAAASAIDPQALRLALVCALSLAAWIALATWSLSPYARYLEHGGWADAGLIGELCRSIPQGSIIIPALIYAFAWLLMITAMMLPTTLPLLGIFGRVVAGRPDAGALLGRVIAGYAIAWLGFGLLAHGADSLLHAAAAQVGWLVGRGWVVGAVVLAGAGAFQFSALKYRCLERCRTPFAFVNERWHGRAPAPRGALHWRRARRLLRRLLLGLDGGHVRRRDGQSGADARPGSRDGRREEPSLGASVAHAGRAGAHGLGGNPGRYQPLTAPGAAARRAALVLAAARLPNLSHRTPSRCTMRPVY